MDTFCPDGGKFAKLTKFTFFSLPAKGLTRFRERVEIFIEIFLAEL